MSPFQSTYTPFGFRWHLVRCYVATRWYSKNAWVFYSSLQQFLEVLPPGALFPGRLWLPGTLDVNLHSVNFALSRVRQTQLLLRSPKHGKRPRDQDVVFQGSLLLSAVILMPATKISWELWWARQRAEPKKSSNARSCRLVLFELVYLR